MAAMEKNNKTLNVPHLRFPEFSGEWEKELLGTTCKVLMCKRILASQTNSDCGVPFYKIGTIGGVPDAYISKELFESYRAKYNYPRKGEVMITCAGTVGKAMIFDGHDSYYQDSNIVWIDNPTNTIDNTFLYHFISKVDWSKLNTTTIVRIYNDDLRQLWISYPTLSEQRKISIFLNLLNQRIETQKKIIEDLKKLKDVIRTKLFRQIESTCSVYDEIRNMLDYEQPSEYLVNSTEYSDDYQIPVLTANKAFILGYTDEAYGIYDKRNCIILDDFTMDVKYVTFPFKVKSSAIKILTAKQHVDLYFMYEYLLYLGLVSEEHKRHYISEIESMNIVSPPLETQKHIAQTLQTISMKIESATSYYGLLSKQKQYLLNQLFI